jgi:hypothetical protein
MILSGISRMNSVNSSPSFAASLAHVLPKIGVVVFLLMWGTQGRFVPLERLSLIFGGLLLLEALTAAALVKQRTVLAWGDLAAVGRALVGPAALPFYLLVAGGVYLVSAETDPVRRMNAANPAERTGVPSRIVPTPRSTPAMSFPQGSTSRPGTGTPPSINFAPKAPVAPTNTARPPFATPPRPGSTAPAPSTNRPPAVPPVSGPVPAAAPTATAAPVPAAPASTAPAPKQP